MARVDAYDGESKDSKEGPVTFELELHGSLYASQGLACRLLRNEKPVGVVYVSTTEEYIWLSRRINGTFDPETGE